MDVELRHLRCFVVVAEELNFTRAAHRLRVSQPSLTRTITGLERIVGTQLLNRSTRRVTLTAEGDRLRAGAERVLRDLDKVLGLTEDPTPLRLGFTWLLPDGWAQQVITRFERDTGVLVELVRRDESCAGVDVGHTDIAVLRGEAPWPGLKSVPLFQERRVLAVRRGTPLAARRCVRWQAMSGWPLVVNTVSGTTRPELWPDGSRPRRATECANFDEWLEAIAANRGVGVVPISAAYRVVHPAIRFVALEGAPLVEVSLVYPRPGRHPFTNEFVAAARRVSIPPHTTPPPDLFD